MELYTVAAFWYLVVVTGFSVIQAEIERMLSVSERQRGETFISRVIRVMGASRE
jgi:hypothetical protein